MIVETKKQHYIFYILQPSKEISNVHVLKLQKILKISFWTFKICPKSKSAPTFYTKNVSTFFLVPFFQFIKVFKKIETLNTLKKPIITLS